MIFAIAVLGLGLIFEMLPSQNGLARQAQSEDYIDRPYARLAILDKITARVKHVMVMVGVPFQDAALSVQVARCAVTPPEYTPESVAFVDINEQQAADQQPMTVFRGWMFASSPGLSAVEHPIYDLWLTDCLQEIPKEIPKATVEKTVDETL